MKRFKKVLFISLSTVIVLGGIVLFLLQPVIALGQLPPYAGDNKFDWKQPAYNPSKKTVFIIADNKLTEMFDMLAPYYLFNATGKLNVYIIAKEKAPIQIKRDLFVLPQLTFKEADSLKINADVIVVPALSKRDEKQDSTVVSFIKHHFSPNTKLLAVCDGSSTAAATGLYDGKPITTHASDFEMVKSHFSKPEWIQHVNVAHSGNLYSTAGVSNAVEGSLTVINDLFGSSAMQAVARDIQYPHADISTSHQSIAINGGNKLTIAGKVITKKNRRIGVLLQDGVNEFQMVSILDTYGRTFPKYIKCIMVSNSTIQTKYGLTLVCSGGNPSKKLDEVHILQPVSNALVNSIAGNTETVRYNLNGQYPIDVCLARIGVQYGDKFQNVVKLLLDYN
jgi:putative intracellular protease/amidase